MVIYLCIKLYCITVSFLTKVFIRFSYIVASARSTKLLGLFEISFSLYFKGGWGVLVSLRRGC